MVEDEENKDPWKLEPDGTFAVRELEINKLREKELYEAAIKLKPGELSGVVTTSDSLHVLKLKQYTPEKQFTFEEVRKAIEAKLRAKAEGERLRAWQAELRKGAKIEIPETQGGK
jgi:parvulin-like peptidyl-prolyl isomerase